MERADDVAATVNLTVGQFLDINPARDAVQRVAVRETPEVNVIPIRRLTGELQQPRGRRGDLRNDQRVRRVPAVLAARIGMDARRRDELRARSRLDLIPSIPMQRRLREAQYPRKW